MKNDDINLLDAILKATDEVQNLYNKLSNETQDFLLKEFEGETLLKLYDFERNIAETIQELDV